MNLYQEQAYDWAVETFGHKDVNDPAQRNHRFLEEALELVQACGCTEHEAHELVSYAFRRPAGEKAQEVGGVMMTLAVLCQVQNVVLWEQAWQELRRVWGKIDQIRSKQAIKPALVAITVQDVNGNWIEHATAPQCVSTGPYVANSDQIVPDVSDDAALRRDQEGAPCVKPAQEGTTL